MFRIWAIVVVFIFLPIISFAENSHHDHSKHMNHDMNADIADVQAIQLQERLGKNIYMKGVFKNESNEDFILAEKIDRPTIILPIFFSCPVVCPIMLTSLAENVVDIPFIAGKDYNIITLSFNDEENSAIAAKTKKNYLHLLPKSFDKNAWTFLTGKEKDILDLTNSIGFFFKKTAPNTFVHPNALVVVDEKGTIIRYIYGSHFLGSDIGMAIKEAQENQPSTSIKRIVSMCFNYDSEGKIHLSIFFKVVATLMLIAIVLFFIVFLRRK